MLAALALCAVLLVSLVPAARAAQADGQLQFDENGEFRILIVADTQDIDKPQKETIALLEAELDAAQLDGSQDFVPVLLVLCQDMYDNRALYVDSANVNQMVQSILDMHSVNLLPSVMHDD